ncbi:MAG: zf-TFIIB domain-containing protein [Dongiaceae bacterium]
MNQAERQTATGMPCPTCKVDLVMSDRQGIEIDYCPKCRGVWLDRGELDKIIERNATQARERPAANEPPRDPYAGYASPGYGHHGGYGKHGYRRKSWLHELFD